MEPLNKQYHSIEYKYEIDDLETGKHRTIIGGPHEIKWDKYEDRWVIDVPSAFSCDSEHRILPYAGYVIRIHEPTKDYRVIWALELIREMTAAYIWKEDDNDKVL